MSFLATAPIEMPSCHLIIRHTAWCSSECWNSLGPFGSQESKQYSRNLRKLPQRKKTGQLIASNVTLFFSLVLLRQKKAIIVFSTGIQASWTNRRQQRRKTTSLLPTASNSSRETQPLFTETLLPWLLTLKWGWGGEDPGSTPSTHSGALLAPEPPGLAMPSDLVLNHWLRLWLGNSPAVPKASSRSSESIWGSQSHLRRFRCSTH